MKKIGPIALCIVCLSLLFACHREAPPLSLLQQPALYEPSSSQQVLGDPRGEVTIVEFFDYHCEACAIGYPALLQYLTLSSSVRVVLREIPLLGDVSLFAARAAVAAIPQGKYRVFHDALMNVGSALDEQSVLTIAAHQGLDMDRLEKEMNSAYVTDVLSQNVVYARALHIEGTPVYLIASTPRTSGRVKVGRVVEVFGAMSVAQLEQAVAKVRA